MQGPDFTIDAEYLHNIVVSLPKYTARRLDMLLLISALLIPDKPAIFGSPDSFYTIYPTPKGCFAIKFNIPGHVQLHVPAEVDISTAVTSARRMLDNFLKDDSLDPAPPRGGS